MNQILFTKKQRKILLLLSFIFLSFCMIYLTDIKNQQIWSLGGNSDSRFHVLRIEGLAAEIKHGNWFPTLNMVALDGFGYASPIFYPNWSLYFPAILRILGCSPAVAFISMLVIFNFLTLCSCFWSFYQLIPNYKKSFLFSIIYTFSGYHFRDLIYRQDIGELAGMIFLPIIFVGAWQILRGVYSKWPTLVFGMVGTILVHPLTPILAAFILVIMFVGSLKFLKNEHQRIVAGLKAISLSVLLSLGYFIPMVVQLQHDKLRLLDTSKESTITLLNSTTLDLKTSLKSNLLNQIDQPIFGLIILIGLIILTFQSLLKHIKGFDLLLLLSAWFFVILTLDSPLWNLLVNSPLGLIQRASRLNMIICLLISFLMAKYSDKIISNRNIFSIICLFTIAIAILSSFQMTRRTSNAYQSYSDFNHINTKAIGGGYEYLPTHTNVRLLMAYQDHNPKYSLKDIKITNFHQNGSSLSLKYKAKRPTTVTLPVIGYFGYHASVNGTYTPVRKNFDNNELLMVNLHGSGKLKVSYDRPQLAKISIFISSITLLSIIIYIIVKRIQI